MMKEPTTADRDRAIRFLADTNSGDPITSIGRPLTIFDLVEPGTPQRFYRFDITP